ncbi:ATP-binding cassette domain-containing protein [Microlunatus sp. Gsoil 973]|uniref:ATP-binding cassette domain-containing protein n=1 Tax=Microlunatus sp. Gsoil 973 TaxID=2672569 RepID=UPI0012B4A5E9|nr:ATP-binding cassette domain-containing protein [Microlunatus sp. Gsoil 973]QGN34773.1 ATP-binding cassette domain-containing protein [Microlunatus sp. Gsoil 973]
MSEVGGPPKRARAGSVESPSGSPGTGRRSLRTSTPPILIDALTKNFGTVRAVSGLTFSVQPGRITGFLGPNGAGKSTTLRILVGLAAATTGTATFGGTPYADLDHPQQRVGAVLEPAFHPGRSGRNHLRVLATTAGVGGERIDELLHLVGLTGAADRRVGGYSLGMRQRLALAGALLGDPDYLILDEPANGLDPEGIRWLRGFLRSFAALGRVVLMSSHILNEVEATVDDVVVIGNGRLIRQAPMSELAASTSARVRVADPQAAGAVLDRLQVPWQLLQDAAGPYLVVAGLELASIGSQLFSAGIPVLELATQEVDLESEFFAMLADQDGTKLTEAGA